RDLVGGLALVAQCDEERRDLLVRRLAAHDLVHRLSRLGARKVVAVEQSRGRLLDHSRPSRKLRASVGPSGVNTDSAWNWTPTRACWPSPTPSVGVVGPSRRMTSSDAAASPGRPGPGEMTSCAGARRSASSASSSSLRSTFTSTPSAPNRCARLYVNES